MNALARCVKGRVAEVRQLAEVAGREARATLARRASHVVAIQIRAPKSPKGEPVGPPSASTRSAISPTGSLARPQPPVGHTHWPEALSHDVPGATAGQMLSPTMFPQRGAHDSVVVQLHR